MRNLGSSAPRLILFLLFAVAAGTARGGEWLEASSDHFIIYSEASEKKLREFATGLERFDRGLHKIFKSKSAEDEGRRSNRLRIYVVSGVRAVRKLHGVRNSGVGGFYVPRIGGSLAFTPRTTGEFIADAQDVLLHEYSHHFMFANFAAAYPRWFSEGFAELGSTARFEKDGGLSFGLPANHRAAILFAPRVLDLDELLDISARPKLTALQNEAIYGRGWLFTHFLIFSPERRGQLTKYLDAFNLGTPSVAAGTAAFGDLDLLDKELDAYKKKPLRYITMSAADLPIGEISIRPLSAGEAEMMPIHMTSTRGVSREQALELIPDARRVAARYPDEPRVQAHLAEAEYDAGNLDEAEAAVDRALALDAKNLKALLYKGRIVMRRAAEEKSGDEKAWKAARSWFIKANAVDNNAAEALYLFYTTYLAERAKPSENAVLALNRAFELSPEDTGLRLQVAHQALNDDKPALARTALTPIAYDPHYNPWREAAAAAIALIVEGKTAEAHEALMRPRSDEGGSEEEAEGEGEL